MKIIPCSCSKTPQAHDRVWDANQREFLLQCRNCLQHKPLVVGKNYPSVSDQIARKKNPVPLSKNAQLKKASKIFEDFTGYDAAQKIKIDKPDFPDVLCVIGDIDEIFYTTDRDGAIEKYRHKFEKNCRPLFCVSPDGEQIFMLGGAYKFTERGIVDRVKKR